MNHRDLLTLIDRMKPSCPLALQEEAEAFVAAVRRALTPGTIEDGDGDPRLVCPHCGFSHDPGALPRYVENIGNERRLAHVERLTPDPGLTQPPSYFISIDGFYETDGWDDGENGRLLCRDCSEPFDFPKETDYDFE